jgi:hypothetical protein
MPVAAIPAATWGRVYTDAGYSFEGMFVITELAEPNAARLTISWKNSKMWTGIPSNCDTTFSD